MLNFRLQKFAGPTAHGVLGSASQSLCLYSLNIFDNGRRPGSPGDQSIPLGDGPERCFRPLAPQGSIFIDFLTTQNDIEKTMIFRILKNRPKWQNQSTLERPRSTFGAKTPLLLGSLLASIFRLFPKTAKVCYKRRV